MNTENNIENFEKIYALHFYKVRYFAYNYLKDEELATDVAQEVFIKIWEASNKPDYTKDVVPYLITIAKNICMNILKRRKIKQRYDNFSQNSIMETINSESLHELPISVLYSNEVEKILVGSLNEMSPSIKETYLLNKVKCHKYKEIAQIQNISIKTVEWRIASAMRILQKRFKDYLPLLLSFLFR
ncbi:MAG: sigma-70 family RNA polymerase sigma factor [Bacteroidales bacterium]